MAVFWDAVPAVYTGRSLPAFQSCLLPPSSGRRVLIVLMTVALSDFSQYRFITLQRTPHMTCFNITFTPAFTSSKQSVSFKFADKILCAFLSFLMLCSSSLIAVSRTILSQVCK
jgi:hypothetical protein